MWSVVSVFFPLKNALVEGREYNHSSQVYFPFRFLLRFVLQDGALRTIVQCYSKYDYEILQTYRKVLVSPCQQHLLRQCTFNTVNTVNTVPSQCFPSSSHSQTSTYPPHELWRPPSNDSLALCMHASFKCCPQPPDQLEYISARTGFLGLGLGLA